MDGYNLAELAWTLFEESGDALFLFNPDSERMLDVNLMAQRLSGSSREELLARAVPTLFRSDSADEWERLRQAYRKTGPFHSQEGFWLRHRDPGVWVPVNLTVARLHAGRQTLGLITARDISERRRTEEALRTNEARYRSLLQNLEQSVFLKDTQYRFVAANRRFCEGIGRAEADILGKTDFDFYPPSLAEKYQADDRGVLLEGRRLELEEQNLLGGRIRRVRVIKTPVRDSQEHVVGVLGIFWDVTEQHALEEQLRQAQKMEAVGQLAGGVAHDFNNLLTAILGNLSLLQANLPPGDANRAVVDAAERAAWRAAKLTSQLLGFSRRALLHPQPTSANQTIDEVAGLLGRTIDPRITLQTRKAPDLWVVQADPNQLSQVLMNLCINARDALQPILDGVTGNEPVGPSSLKSEPAPPAAPDAPSSGESPGKAFLDRPREAPPTILLEAANLVLTEADVLPGTSARVGEFVRLCVCDNGTGIAPEALPHIFEPFFTTKGPGKGTGLGLAMVFGIVQQHHGWIECHSVLGRGTCFDIYLPRLHSPHAAPAAAPTTPTLRGGKETILLVDDEPLVRNFGRSVLEGYGYRVLLAGDGEEAVEMYRQDPSRIDLVLLDLTMPRLSGREALRELLGINPQVRVLLASGYSAEHLTEQDREHILGFLHKPYRPETLVRSVRNALDGIRTQRQPT
jgi:two-component system cell cycle sensor histidine kinase/response regulator CckA